MMHAKVWKEDGFWRWQVTCPKPHLVLTGRHPSWGTALQNALTEMSWLSLGGPVC